MPVLRLAIATVTLTLLSAQNQTPTKPAASEAKDEVRAQVPTATVPAVPAPAVSKSKRPRLHLKRKPVAAPDAAKVKAMKIPAGAPVALRLADSKKITGTLDGMTTDGLSIRAFENGRSVTQSVPFAQIASLKQKGKAKAGRGPQTPKMLDSSLTSIPEGAPVTFTLADNTQVSGRYAGKTPDGVGVKVPQGGQMATRNLALNQVAGVKQPKGKLPDVPGLQSPAMVKKSLSGIPAGSPVTLNMPGGGQLSGKMAEMTGEGFSLQTLEGGDLVTKKLAFDQVAGVKAPSAGLRGRIPGFKPPGLQTPEVLKAQALGLPTGSPLTLMMPDGSKTTGKLLATNNDGLQMQSMQGGNIVTQNVGFDQIGSIKPGVPKTASGRAKTISKTVVTLAITATITGFISGKISK